VPATPRSSGTPGRPPLATWVPSCAHLHGSPPAPDDSGARAGRLQGLRAEEVRIGADRAQRQ
jgi:hypothetical protein